MKTAKQLNRLLSLALIAYAALATFRASRFDKRLAGLEASHQQLEQKHRRLKEMYLVSVGAVSRQGDSSPAGVTMDDRAFRGVLALRELEDGIDLAVSPPENSSKINVPPRLPGNP